MQEDFLELMLPLVSATIKRAAEKGARRPSLPAALEPQVAKALRRRQRGITGNKIFSEAETVFKVHHFTTDCVRHV